MLVHICEYVMDDTKIEIVFFFINFREEIEPIGEGPQYNPDGKADVSTSLHGSQTKYTITADDFVRARDTPREKVRN